MKGWTGIIRALSQRLSGSSLTTVCFCGLSEKRKRGRNGWMMTSHFFLFSHLEALKVIKRRQSKSNRRRTWVHAQMCLSHKGTSKNLQCWVSSCLCDSRCAGVPLSLSRCGHACVFFCGSVNKQDAHKMRGYLSELVTQRARSEGKKLEREMTNLSAARRLCLCVSSSTSAAPVFLLSCAIFLFFIFFATIKILIPQLKSYPDFYPNFILRHQLSFKTLDFQWRTLTCFFIMSPHCRLALIVSNSHGDLRQMHQHSKGNVRGCRRDVSPASLNLIHPAEA